MCFIIPMALAALLVGAAAIHQEAPKAIKHKNLSMPVIAAGDTMSVRHQYDRPPAPPRVGEALLLAAFPPGSTWDVELCGGFVGTLSPERPRVSPEPNVAYAFELTLRRHIKSNDGECVRAVIEFRHGAAVKVLSGAEPLVLADLAEGARRLRFPELDGLAAGEVALIPAERIAAAILAQGADEVARCRASRGFLQRDTLAGNRVAITYRDGVGIESIMPLDAAIGRHEIIFLRESGLVCEAALLPVSETEKTRMWLGNGRMLGGLLAPSMRALPAIPIRLSLAHLYGCPSGRTRRALRVHPAVDDRSENGSLWHCFNPEGIVYFAEDGPWIARASLRWTMARERNTDGSVLFENYWLEPPQIVIHYRSGRHSQFGNL